MPFIIKLNITPRLHSYYQHSFDISGYNATEEKYKLIPAHGHLSGFVKSAQTTSNECEPGSVEPCPVGEEAEAGKESLTENSGGHASEPIPIIK